MRGEKIQKQIFKIFKEEHENKYCTSFVATKKHPQQMLKTTKSKSPWFFQVAYMPLYKFVMLISNVNMHQ